MDYCNGNCNLFSCQHIYTSACSSFGGARLYNSRAKDTPRDSEHEYPVIFNLVDTSPNDKPDPEDWWLQPFNETTEVKKERKKYTKRKKD